MNFTQILLWLTSILMGFTILLIWTRKRLYNKENKNKSTENKTYKYDQFVPLFQSFAELSEIEKFQLSTMLTDIIAEPQLQNNNKVMSLKQFIQTVVKSNPAKYDKSVKKVKNGNNIKAKPSLDSEQIVEIPIEKKTFEMRLIEAHPDLSDKEVLLCNYIINDKSIREISEISGMKNGSIRVYKTKLKSKLNLPPNVILKDYLNRI